MKGIFILILMLISVPCFAQSWGASTKEKASSFFDSGNKTQVIVNKDSTSEEKTNSNGLSGKESTYNLDFEGLSYMMPDQPASDQMLTTFTGFGFTYKFSDKMHIVTKIMQFEIEGVQGVNWKHKHYLAGFGVRDRFGDNQIIQANLMTGSSEVTGDGIGKVKNLEMPVFFDIKYMWMFGESFIIGPQVTFGRVASTCKEPDGKYSECGHGGYTAIGLAIQIGIPDDMER